MQRKSLLTGTASCADQLGDAQLIIKTLSKELAEAKSWICSLSEDDAPSWKLLQAEMMCQSPTQAPTTTVATITDSTTSSPSEEESSRKLLQVTPAPSLNTTVDRASANTKQGAPDNEHDTREHQLPVAMGKMDHTDTKKEVRRRQGVCSMTAYVSVLCLMSVRLSVCPSARPSARPSVRPPARPPTRQPHTPPI